MEFWKVEVLGSAADLGGVRGGFRVVLVVEWVAEMLEFWVRLGEEMEVICRVLDAGFRWKGRRKKMAEF